MPQTPQIFEGSSGVNFLYLLQRSLDLSNVALLKNQQKAPSGPLIIEPDCKRELDHIRKGVQVIHMTDSNRTVQELTLRKRISAKDENRFSPWRNNE
jgi:hypothetical protein